MIEAQMTLPDGVTPGCWRKGSAAILMAIAGGCKIYPNPRNKIPDEFRKHLLVLDTDMGTVDAPPAPVPQQPEKPKRGRPKKLNA